MLFLFGIYARALGGFMSKKILVLGSVNADHVLRVNNFPRPGETVTGMSYDIIPGGKGANQAVACARLGGNTGFMACIGQDAFGNNILEKFAEDGVDTTLVEQIENIKTGVAMIFVDDNAENCIGIAAEANLELDAERVQKNRKGIESADYLLLQLETPNAILEAVKLGRESKTTVVLNPAPARALSDEVLACVDMITPNQTEAEMLTGVAVTSRIEGEKAAKVFHDKGIQTVVITMGKQGALLSENINGNISSAMVEGFKMNAIDTTAAGDTFNGALLVALSEGKTLTDAARFANASAALSVTRHGAQTSIPSRSDVDQFLSSR